MQAAPLPSIPITILPLWRQSTRDNQQDGINQPANAEQSQREDVQHAEARVAEVKTMDAEVAEQDAQYQCDYLALAARYVAFLVLGGLVALLHLLFGNMLHEPLLEAGLALFFEGGVLSACLGNLHAWSLCGGGVAGGVAKCWQQAEQKRGQHCEKEGGFCFHTY